VRIERIVSTGQVTAPGTWLDQAWDEWVVIVSGAATLELEDAPPLAMQPGDHLLIPAGRKHRVVWTDPDRATVWLAVHLGEGAGG
jgi:cupin 2 domain-containing protein